MNEDMKWGIAMCVCSLWAMWCGVVMGMHIALSDCTNGGSIKTFLMDKPVKCEVSR